MRSRAAKEISESERHRNSSQMQAVNVWLDTNLALLHDELDRLAHHCYPGSTDWIIKSSKMKAWLQNRAGQPICWLVGKPGAGKSVICSKLIQDLQNDQQCSAIFYLCNHFGTSPNEAGQILRSLVSQLVQQRPDLVPYILDEYVSRGVPASGSQLRKMIPKLLMGFSCLRIIVDGLDEIEESQQRQVLSDLIDFATNPLGPGSYCKILIASRDATVISRFLSQRTVLSLGDDLQAFQAAVQPYVHHELSELRKSLSDIEVEQTTMDVIEHRLVEKSNGNTPLLHCFHQILS
jgi:Cdc6-like AAA superfamily ATPase